jgi:flagellar biosynthesis GTPase FlhF
LDAKIMKATEIFIAIACSLSITGCANLQTIHRSTPIPAQIGADTPGKAIHLDAQQRLVLTTARGFCAEPSPDALAAYAASLGLGVSVPGQGSGSAAQALQSAAGSIGLRTQSITLMRDALYRMCEASNNGHLNQFEVAGFLRRSQDLTAVVLAIEQLTGAVAARQIALTPSAGSSAFASLVSNQQLLDQATTNLANKEAKLEEAKEKLKTAQKERDEAKTAKETEDAKLKALNEKQPPAKKEEIEKAESETKRAGEDLTRKDKDLEAAQSSEQTAEQLRDQAKEVKEAIEASRDAALTNATANTSSSAQFGTPIQQNALSKEATQAVATAVENMVKEALDKTYTADLCMSYLLETSKTADNLQKLLDIEQYQSKKDSNSKGEKVFQELRRKYPQKN